MWYWDIHIKTLDLFGLEIQVWGLLLAIGVFVGWTLFDYLLMKRKIKFDSSWLVVGVVFSGLLGARLLQIMLDWDYYSQNLIEVFYVWNGGMASFGAIVLIFLFLYLYFKKYVKSGVDDYLDAASVSLMSFLVFARIGCFLINDHFGNVTELSWGIYTMGEMRHPISMYYIINAFVIAAVLLYLYLKGKCKKKLFGIMMVLYGIGRTLIDVLFKDFMDDESRYWFLIAFTIVLTLSGVGYIILKKDKKTIPAH